MDKDTTNLANELIQNGFCAVPCRMPEKKPDVYTWTQYQKQLPRIGEHQFNGSLGVITGAISNGLTVLDIDLKYDLTGTLHERLRDYIGEDFWQEIASVAYIQTTINNGVHIFFRCEEVEKNQKLASRPATEDELKKSQNKQYTLIETRGEGGFIVLAPTQGYEAKIGTLKDCGYLTIEQKERLFEICRSFNEYFDEVKIPKQNNVSSTGLTPWDDYNQRGPVTDLLQSHGWTYVRTIGDNQHFCRPDKTGTTSGTWNESKRLFYCFTSSTGLEPSTAYSPTAMFTYFECNRDFTEAGRKLYSLGYGERFKTDHTNTSSSAKTQHGGNDDWISSHVYLTPSMIAGNKFSHILVDDGNVCNYYESTGSGKPSEPLKERIASLRKLTSWPKFDNEGLKVFDESLIQRDTPDECFLYYTNGTLRITRDQVDFIPGSQRQLVWASLVLQRDYKPSSEQHEIATLAELATVDYQKLKIGIGYLLHRHWKRNMTKIVWACDHKPMSRHDGRRGKDLFTTLVSLCRKWTPVKWKRGANFWTSSIQPDSAIVHFEDVSNALAVDEEMKKTITGDFSIEHKGQNIVTRKFSDKPKFSASSQKYPLDYMDASIRGRIWLVEFTDYLQKNPPKKTLVYDDTDLSSFDAWIVDCIQTYFRNIDQLIGTPELTTEQRIESLRVTYGSNIINAVETVAEEIEKNGFILSAEVNETLEIENGDGKTLLRFKEAFHKVTGKELNKTQRTISGSLLRIYEVKKQKHYL